MLNVMTTNRLFTWAFFVLTSLALLSMAGCTRPDQQNGDLVGTEAVVEEAYGVGDDVIAGDIKWNVTKAYSAESLRGIFGEYKEPQGRFVVVNVSVENLGKKAKSMFHLRLVDSTGREFANATELYKNLGPDQLFILENLNPNVPYSFSDVYDIPVDAEGLKLIVDNLSFFGNEQVQVELGF